ncbi:unnamed protein product [Angiostrongylus costaricensis]|uniref:BHLH domain-containing protein n=1 Tax=Angiostrongylus costaricensis TaxID=334426 RepID=A0A0R3PTU5_ANGCS|nr:unnamed protein product [Angiostrongylus costaricensis]
MLDSTKSDAMFRCKDDETRGVGDLPSMIDSEQLDKLKAVRARRIRVLQQIETIGECIKLVVDVLLAEVRRFSGIREMLMAEMRCLSTIQQQDGNLPHEEKKVKAG